LDSILLWVKVLKGGLKENPHLKTKTKTKTQTEQNIETPKATPHKSLPVCLPSWLLFKRGVSLVAYPFTALDTL
jgi:hypothetical protein